MSTDELILVPRRWVEGYEDMLENCGYRKEAQEVRDLLAAKLALSKENQRITAVRFHCLACGEYHEGSGNLPCPKMTLTSGAKP